MGKCLICNRKIYTGIYCTDCMYKDTSIIPKFEKAGVLKSKLKKEVQI